MKINDNIGKIKECAIDVINISKEYNMLIDDMFENIKKVKETIDISKESSFERLISEIASEKNIYTNYGTNINRMGNVLLEYASGINDAMQEKGIKGNALLYDGDKITNDVTPPISDAKKYIESAKECVNEVKIDFDCGQYTINNDVSQIIKQVEQYNSWNINTKAKYTKILDDLNIAINQIKIDQIRKRTQNINTI